MTHAPLLARWELANEAATEGLAARVATTMPQQPEPLILYLRGALGSGKTTFTRGMLRKLGEAGPVRSPTYGLQTEYHLSCGRVIHMDLYRLNQPEDLLALALPDLLPDSRLWLIEWPERSADSYLPRADLQVEIEVLNAGREVVLRGASAVGNEWIQNLFRDLS
jgi:tRNA threonylcarbamoyladenosine biosynthesis protein TsaE